MIYYPDQVTGDLVGELGAPQPTTYHGADGIIWPLVEVIGDKASACGVGDGIKGQGSTGTTG